MKTLLLASLGLIGCAARQPDPPRACSTADDCERVYEEEMAAYNACRDSGYGARCEDEESRMNAAYEQHGKAEAREQTQQVEEAEHQRELAMAADRKAQAVERKLVSEQHQAVVDASLAEDERRAEAQRQKIAARQEVTLTRAGDLGFEDIVLLETGGLADYLRAVMREGVDVKTLSKVLIELSPEDASLSARKVENGEGIFANGTGVVVLFRAPKGKIIYNGTLLPSLAEAVRITGVRSLTAPNGISGQAFVVAPVW